MIRSRVATISVKEIRELSRRIADEFHPVRIILLGSYAWGKPTGDSDIDLLIVMPLTERPTDKAVEIQLRVKPTFPVDLIVRTPEKIEQRLALGDSFIRDMLQAGKVLYEANHG